MQGMSGNTRTKKFLCKPAEKKNLRLTTGSLAVCKRFINERTSARHLGLQTSTATPFCFCKHFYPKDVWETCNEPVEFQTQTPRAGRVGAVHGGAAGRRGGAGLGRTGCRWVDSARRQTSLLPSSTSRTLSSRFVWNYEHSNSYLKSTEEQKTHG